MYNKYIGTILMNELIYINFLLLHLLDINYKSIIILYISGIF